MEEWPREDARISSIWSLRRPKHDNCLDSMQEVTLLLTIDAICMMIHISSYFNYLAMVWSCCGWISEGPLYSVCEVFKRKNLKQLLFTNQGGQTSCHWNLPFITTLVKAMRKSKSCKFALTIPEVNGLFSNTQLHDKNLLHLIVCYKFDT